MRKDVLQSLLGRGHYTKSLYWVNTQKHKQSYVTVVFLFGAIVGQKHGDKRTDLNPEIIVFVE